jgi:hypothetical protein
MPFESPIRERHNDTPGLPPYASGTTPMTVLRPLCGFSLFASNQNYPFTTQISQLNKRLNH